MKEDDKEQQASNPEVSNDDDAIKDAPEIIELVDIVERLNIRKLYLSLLTETAQMN